MCDQFKRRSFLKSLAICPTFSVLNSLWSSAYGDETPLDFDFKYRLHGEGWDEMGRRGIIAEAMAMISKMSHPRFAKRAREISGSDCKLAGDTWANSELTSWLPNAESADLLFWQMSVLGGTDKAIVNVRPYYSDDFDWGRANLNLVKIKFLNDFKYSFEGEFDIQLNFTRLGSDDRHSSPSSWAGLICHELLHNLGHVHDKGEYRVNLQINAMQQAVFEHFSDEDLVASNSFRCGGRVR